MIVVDDYRGRRIALAAVPAADGFGAKVPFAMSIWARPDHHDPCPTLAALSTASEAG